MFYIFMKATYENKRVFEYLRLSFSHEKKNTVELNPLPEIDWENGETRSNIKTREESTVKLMQNGVLITSRIC